MADLKRIEAAIWSMADGRDTADDVALFEADERVSVMVLDRLLGEADENLEDVRNLRGDERDQVVADFEDTIASLLAVLHRYRPPAPEPERPAALGSVVLPPTPVALQASWIEGQVVVWASGRHAQPETNDDLATRLETVGGPPQGWQLHPGIDVPGGGRADALSISLKEALGWLVAVGAGGSVEGIGASLMWVGRVALEGVRLVAAGSMLPGLQVPTPRRGRPPRAATRWVPAFSDPELVDRLAASMPATVSLNVNSARATTLSVINGVVATIAAGSVERMDLPAPPPDADTPTQIVSSMVAHLEGSPFRAELPVAKEVSRQFEHWSRAVTDPTQPRLVVRLDPPSPQGVWLVTVQAAMGKGKLVPIDAALRGSDSQRGVTSEWNRLQRLFPAIDRGAASRRGQVALSQDEAWGFMTIMGPLLASVGFDVRAPALSRRTAKGSLRLFAEAPAGSTVGAHQLSNVSWSVVFDDVELSPAEIAKLARQARPLVQSRGVWVEIDRVDLEKAAAALAERASVTQLTGAEILRQSLGLDGTGLSGGVMVHGNSWANDILRAAGEVTHELDVTPDGFDGELRSYQAEALAWIGFLEATELGGCLALDMGLGKTPTVLAHLARTIGSGPTLVVAPAAVVGNWAAEAGRFAPKLRVMVHHGISRAGQDELADDIANADLVITTYATAVRDVAALSSTVWSKFVLDEAQAIKNPTSDTAQQLRRITARTKIALTGTPIENGVGDLWAILDFTNPGLVGPRPSFVAQLSGDRESAMKALNGLLLFRRTKNEPEVARELPDKIDELDHCTMTPEQIGLYQAVLDTLLADVSGDNGEAKQGAILAAITALKQICNHPAAYHDDGLPLAGRSGKLARLEELLESVFSAGERVLIFTHFASWGRRLAEHLTTHTGMPIHCYDGSLTRPVRDKMVTEFQNGEGPGALVLSLKAGGTGLNLTAANHVVLYDRWWNPAVEDQARDRAWRLGQQRTVISHRLVCPGTVDERVEEVVAGKRHIASLVLPKSSSIADLNTDQLRLALGLRADELLAGDER